MSRLEEPQSKAWSCGTLTDGIGHVMIAAKVEPDSDDEKEAQLLKELQDSILSVHALGVFLFVWQAKIPNSKSRSITLRTLIRP